MTAPDDTPSFIQLELFTEPAKFCAKCKEHLPLSSFSKHKPSRGAYKDGLSYQCKACDRKDRDPVRRRERYAANAAANRAYSRAWYHENKERARVVAKTYYEAHKREFVKRAQARDKREPGKAWGRFHAYRARRRNAPVIEQIDRSAIIERDGAICYLCGQTVDRTLPRSHPESLTLDHVIPLIAGGAHTADNLRVTHRRCNSSKGAKVLTA